MQFRKILWLEDSAQDCQKMKIGLDLDIEVRIFIVANKKMYDYAALLLHVWLSLTEVADKTRRSSPCENFEFLIS